MFASVHASPLDAIRAGALANRLWDRTASPLGAVLQFVYFCGWPGFALMLFGLFELAKRRAWRTLALLAGPPLFFSAVLLGSLWESRQFLTLTPFIGALAARGAQAALADMRGGRRVMPACLAIITLVVFLAPVRRLVISDGPRVLFGRLWGVSLWTDWQAGVRRDMATVDGVVAGLPQGRTLAVLTDGWDDDRYLHLRLVERGFRRSTLPSACGVIGEQMGRGDRALVQLTLLQSFVPYWPALQAQRLEQGALPCLAATHPGELVLLGRKGRIDALLDPHPGKLLGPDLGITRNSPIVAVRLDAKGLAALGQAYRREAAAMGGSRGWLQAQAGVVSQTGFSRPVSASGS